MTTKQTAKRPAKGLLIGRVVPTTPAPPTPPKSDADRIIAALDDLDSTLRYRLEAIEDNINYLSQSIGTGLDGIERAIRNEPRREE
jgi:hypothetical protein